MNLRMDHWGAVCGGESVGVGVGVSVGVVSERASEKPHSNGSLGSRNDEERSKARKVVRVARCESLSL